jgi:lipopolysaccharide export system protein LptC
MAVVVKDDGVEATPRRRGRLDSLPSRQRTTGEQAAQRSVLVRRLRIALPVLALVLIGALLLNTRDAGEDDAFLDDFANLEATPEDLRLASTGTKLVGVDDDGNPYEITAESLLQGPESQSKTIELVKPRAVTRGVDESTVASASKGVFYEDQKVLELNEGVTLEHQIGRDMYQLRTSAATVSIDDETVESRAAVEGEGAAGTLRADSMRAYNGEGRVVFEGNVSMRIYPDKAKTTTASGPEDNGG